MTKPAVNTDLTLACYTIDQLAAVCQVKREKVVEWTHQRGFPVIREQRTIRIPVRAFLDWLDETGRATNALPAPTHLASLPIRRRTTSGVS